VTIRSNPLIILAMSLWDNLRDKVIRLCLGRVFARWADAADARAYSVAAIVLAAKLAKVDGPITRAEIDTFKSVFRIDPDDVKEVGRVWRAAKRDTEGFEPYARKIGVLYAEEPRVLENMVAALFEVARADGTLKDTELRYLERVAQALGLGRRAFARIRAQAEAIAADPYAVLGVRPTASDDEIKQAWRRLVRVYHPDAVSGQGKSRRLVAIATDKTAAINAAYETIVRERAGAAVAA
jgi:DnaJ like chaperone protein